MQVKSLHEKIIFIIKRCIFENVTKWSLGNTNSITQSKVEFWPFKYAYLYGILGLYPCAPCEPIIFCDDWGGAECSGGAWGALRIGVKLEFLFSMISVSSW